ncbi:MAG: hypothetical protein NZ822_02930 [Patescibacteria group bacterium]|nr:hypothetical protein [Patescibacteria group bacterium]
MKLKIIAGPCSVSERNVRDIYELADINIRGRYVVWGTRVVGLKSRTNFNLRGEGMGIDFFYFMRSINKGQTNKVFPSIKIARDIVERTSLVIATEIMDPVAQLREYEKHIPRNKLLIWNPAVNQLGWPIYLMAWYAKRNGWYLGIKNPRWLGDYLKRANRYDYQNKTSAEKTWEGLASYATILKKSKIFLIHRGVDIPEKRDYRNIPIHNLAMRVKENTGCLMLFDPSHSHGPKMKEKIIPATIKAMKMKFPNGQFVYDGILIEVGNSETDYEQHLSIAEFKKLIWELSKFRDFNSRKLS